MFTLIIFALFYEIIFFHKIFLLRIVVKHFFRKIDRLLNRVVYIFGVANGQKFGASQNNASIRLNSTQAE